MDSKELKELLKIGEGYTLEFKESLDKSLGKEICAFANASGGKIILGIADDNSIKRFTLSNKISSQIQDITRNMDPSLHVTFEAIDNVVVVYVPEGKDKPYQVGGEFFIRQGANSQKLKRDEVRALFQKENHIKFDRKANAEFDLKEDFDKFKFESFCEKANIPKNLTREHILKNLSLLTDSKPNNSCVLLFAHRISKFFLNSVVSCVLYRGKERVDILDKKEFDADLLSNFENAVIFVLRNTRTKAIIKGLERIDEPEIPEEALREAIINAMIHRDYFSEGRVQIDIFSDRVEITNPGDLLFPKEELGEFSISRNPILTDCLHRAKYIEKIGSGINRMRQLVPKMSFKTVSGWFRVTFPRIEMSEGLNGKLNGELNGKLSSQLNDVLNIILGNPGVNAQNISSVLDRPIDTVHKQIKTLSDMELIERRGSKKTGGYWVR